MKKLIAYCGLDCETCDAYLATVHDDQALREKTAELWTRLNQAPILPEHINCEGCRVDGVKTPYCSHMCQIRKCAMTKKVHTCGDCSEMERCEMLRAVTANSPQTLENLKLGG